MANCETCGNDYDQSFDVILQGKSHTFDCFECAAQALAPRCARCGVRILGHGVQATPTIFCSAHCAKVAGVRGAVDRLP